MTNELQIISPDELKSIDAKDIEVVIDNIVQSSKANMEEIGQLALESTALLTSSSAHSEALSSQGFLKRCWNNFTGKNDELRNAILQDNTAAQYAAQTMINRVMRECTTNRQLALLVNDRLNAAYLELKEDQLDIAEDVVQIRQAFVAFFKKYSSEIAEQRERTDSLAAFGKAYCPKCGQTLSQSQIICPKCGEIHQLKVGNMDYSTQKKLEEISNLVQQDTPNVEICWNMEAAKIARIIAKAEALADAGQLPGFTPTLRADLERLIMKCKSAEFQIAIVGVMKAGKSMLMNALMGVEIASVGINPETAALTKFRSASGYYVKVRFHEAEQWKKLCESAQKSSQSGEGSLRYFIELPEVQTLSKEWVGHVDVQEVCDSVEDLKEKVKRWTSAQSSEHLFASEVEVGIDHKLFNMPDEVVFVDTPGLHDPVQYRSDITKEYIKKANAVLIAVPTAALTAEGLGTITTVLDYIGSSKEKAYIVATQKDKLNSSNDCEKVISGWIKHLVSAKRYKDEREARRHIIVTSAYMHLCLQKFLSLTDAELDDETKFSEDDLINLESYVKKTLRDHKYDIDELRYSKEDVKVLREYFGIWLLSNRLERNLIAKYRELKMKDIQDEFLRCREELLQVSKKAVRSQNELLEDARKGAGELRKRLQESREVLAKVKVENEKIRKAAEALRESLERRIKEL